MVKYNQEELRELKKKKKQKQNSGHFKIGKSGLQLKDSHAGAGHSR